MAVTVAVLVWFASPVFGQEIPGFLKGKVHRLDQTNLSLAQKFASAEKEFKKAEKGDAYFTGYVFLCRHEIHMDERWAPSEPYRVGVKDNKIKVVRTSKWGKKHGRSMSSKEGSAPAGLFILHRISGNKAEIVDVELVDLDREYEFQDEPVYWLGEVENEESMKLLEQTFDSGGYDVQKTLVFIISSHEHPKTYDFLRRVALGDYATKLRKNAIFWLGNFKDEKSLTYLKEISEKVEGTELRKQVVFALYLCSQDEEKALRELINIAKKDDNRKVRKQAIFWLGQLASKECAKALKDVLEESGDVDVKKSAVFAISQLPSDKSVPILIDIAKTNKSPSIRKNAIFWLGQKDSKEALKFFEEILLKKK
ncbi:MAG: HEAT repeat domain-containing protein [Candidatus Aminicenantes bacterium]|nr:MAG: HEAT repeat domain-containing protein [Candidatus Aminicenantes bacterium]